MIQTQQDSMFDTFPITVLGVYRFRSDLTGNNPEGDGDLRVEIEPDGSPVFVGDPGSMFSISRPKFSKLSSLPNARWYFKSTLP